MKAFRLTLAIIVAIVAYDMMTARYYIVHDDLPSETGLTLLECHRMLTVNTFCEME